MTDIDSTTKTPETEFARFLEAMDLTAKADRKAMSDEDGKAFDELKGTLLRAMDRGTLVIDDVGRPVFTPQLGEKTSLVFNEPTGANLKAMDGARRGHNIERQNLFLASITKNKATVFEAMSMRDYRVCVSLMTLLLA